MGFRVPSKISTSLSGSHGRAILLFFCSIIDRHIHLCFRCPFKVPRRLLGGMAASFVCCSIIYRNVYLYVRFRLQSKLSWLPSGGMAAPFMHFCNITYGNMYMCFRAVIGGDMALLDTHLFNVLAAWFILRLVCFR